MVCSSCDASIEEKTPFKSSKAQFCLPLRGWPHFSSVWPSAPGKSPSACQCPVEDEPSVQSSVLSPLSIHPREFASGPGTSSPAIWRTTRKQSVSVGVESKETTKKVFLTESSHSMTAPFVGAVRPLQRPEILPENLPHSDSIAGDHIYQLGARSWS